MVVKSTRRGDLTRSEMLLYIAEHTRREGFPPTVREISAEVGVSLSAVSFHLRRLEDDGRITIRPGTARGLRLA